MFHGYKRMEKNDGGVTYRGKSLFPCMVGGINGTRVGVL